MRRKPRRQTITFLARVLRLVLAGPARLPAPRARGRPAGPARRGCTCMLWRARERAVRRRVGAARRAAAGRRDPRRARSPGSWPRKVEVTHLAHLEQLETRSDPGARPARAHRGDGLPGAHPRRPRPGAARRHRLASGRRPADDGIRPRLDRRLGARAAAGQALVHEHRLRPRAADLLHRRAAGDLRGRARLRGDRDEPAAGAAAPRGAGADGRDRAARSRRWAARRCSTGSRARRWQVTDPFAVSGRRRLDRERQGPERRELADPLRFPGGARAVAGPAVESSPERNRRTGRSSGESA